MGKRSAAAKRAEHAEHPTAAETAGQATAGGAGTGAPPGAAAAPSPAALDRLIHERMRLGIVSALAVNDSLSFNELKQLMQTTDGNLSVHARKLEDAGYITCLKSFEGRVPRTEFALTDEGRRALERYLDHMEAIIRTTRER